MFWRPHPARAPILRMGQTGTELSRSFMKAESNFKIPLPNLPIRKSRTAFGAMPQAAGLWKYMKGTGQKHESLTRKGGGVSHGRCRARSEGKEVHPSPDVNAPASSCTPALRRAQALLHGGNAPGGTVKYEKASRLVSFCGIRLARYWSDVYAWLTARQPDATRRDKASR